MALNQFQNINDNHEYPLVSCIIPTYNRFTYLLNTIKSIKSQTYTNLEIIVVNDKSTQEEYYTFDWSAIDVKMFHLEKNTREIFGYVCSSYVRNFGVSHSKGEYIAFCDDDDIWLPNKISLQMEAIKNTGCGMCSTDGLYGKGVYDPNKKYQIYNAELNYDYLKEKYKKANTNFLDNGFPSIWTYPFLRIHNCIITSSVLMKKELFDKINGMPTLKNGYEDYMTWLHALQYTNNAYVNDVCFYYDGGHGDGQNYEC